MTPHHAATVTEPQVHSATSARIPSLATQIGGKLIAAGTLTPEAWNAIVASCVTEPDGDALARAREVLHGLVRAMTDLMLVSEGVAGLDHDGDVVRWGKLVSGGQFEQWIGLPLKAARAALADLDGGAS